jgi:hypothetical protein
MPKLEEHPKLKGEIVHILQKMKQVDQQFSTCITQLVLKSLLQAITLKFISESNFIKWHDEDFCVKIILFLKYWSPFS